MSLVALATTFTSCSKDDDKPAPAATALELTIKDELGILIPGAEVKLYPTDADRKASTNQVGTTQISDASGKVKFTDLEAKIYFISTAKADGCLIGVYGFTYNKTTGVQEAIVANTTTSLDIVVVSTGKITLTNNSADYYSLYIKTSGNEYASQGYVGPNFTGSLAVKTGTYDIKLVKYDKDPNQGGVEVAGSDIEKLANVVGTCQTVTVTFPN